nr:hypothetical protein [Mycobacterium sp. E796]
MLPQTRLGVRCLDETDHAGGVDRQQPIHRSGAENQLQIDSHGGALLTGGQAAYQVVGGASLGSQLRAERGIEPRCGRDGSAQLFGDQREFDEAHTGAVEAFGDGQTGPPDLHPALPQLVVDIGAGSGAGAHLLRCAVSCEHAARHVAQQCLFVVELEVHVNASASGGAAGMIDTLISYNYFLEPE